MQFAETLQPYLDRGAQINGLPADVTERESSDAVRSNLGRSGFSLTSNRERVRLKPDLQVCHPSSIHNLNRRPTTSWSPISTASSRRRSAAASKSGWPTDDEYRQQLRDLDQAWEALNALPTTAVDDGFARTTIELACVAAEEDLSQRTALAAVENRGRTRWWIAGGVAAAVIGFVMMRALAVHRNNMLLADLPVIEQVNALRARDGCRFPAAIVVGRFR